MDTREINYVPQREILNSNCDTTLSGWMRDTLRQAAQGITGGIGVTKDYEGYVMFLDAPKHLSPTAEYLIGLIGAMVFYVPLFGLLFIWLFNRIATSAKRPRLAVMVICACTAAVVCLFLGSRDAPLLSIGIWLIIGLVFWGKKEDTVSSLPSEREKLLSEQYANAVTARNEALERSKELEAEFQRMGEKDSTNSVP